MQRDSSSIPPQDISKKINKFEDGFSIDCFSNKHISSDNITAYEDILERIKNPYIGKTLLCLSNTELKIELNSISECMFKGSSYDRFAEIITTKHGQTFNNEQPPIISFCVSANRCTEFIDTFCDRENKTALAKDAKKHIVLGFEYHRPRGAISAEVLSKTRNNLSKIIDYANKREQPLLIINTRGISGLLQKIGIHLARLVTLPLGSVLKKLCGLLIRGLEIAVLLGLSFSIITLLGNTTTILGLALPAALAAALFIWGNHYKRSSFVKALVDVCKNGNIIVLVNDESLAWWMKSLISLLPTDRLIYLGPQRNVNTRLTSVYAPDNIPSWSLTCLCQFLRDASNSYWNTNWIEYHISDSTAQFDAPVPAYRTPFNMSDFFDNTGAAKLFEYHYIHCNHKEYALSNANHILQEKKKNGFIWTTCRIHVDDTFSAEMSNFYPLGNTFYVLDYRKNDSNSEISILRFLLNLEKWVNSNKTIFSMPLFVRVIIIEEDEPDFTETNFANKLLSAYPTELEKLLNQLFKRVAHSYSKEQIEMLLPILNRRSRELFQNIIHSIDNQSSISASMDNAKTLRLDNGLRGSTSLELGVSYEFDV